MVNSVAATTGVTPAAPTPTATMVIAAAPATAHDHRATVAAAVAVGRIAITVTRIAVAVRGSGRRAAGIIAPGIGVIHAALQHRRSGDQQGGRQGASNDRSA